MADSLISSTDTTATQTQDPNTETVATEEAQRPDWLPENFWVEGKPNYENLAKSYSELRTKFSTKEDDLRSKLIEELSAEAINARPETPDAYELPQLSEAIDPAEVANHPLTKWWSEFAYENGFDQDTFKQGIQMYLDAKQAELPNPEEEFKALGDNARARTEAVGLWVGQNFTEAERSVIERMCTTAAGVATVEKIMSMVRGDGSDPITDVAPETTDADVRKMMQDRRYWHPADRDPTYVAKVEAFFQKKYGKKV